MQPESIQFPDRIPYPETDILIMSDPHYLSPALHDSGEAFKQSLIWKKGNLTEYGPEILESFCETAEQHMPDFILVSGDLTNNGERQSHIDLVRYYAELEEKGIEVFVIPGNHDVGFPRPLQFSGSRAYATQSIAPGEFLSLYAPFGYEQALSRDPWSLSYAAEPVEGLILIGLDSCVYGEGYGRIGKETFLWLEKELNQARLKRKRVILFMHHSLLEHFPSQDDDKDMKLTNRKELRDLLMKYGVSTVFTGHYHAQDVALYRKGKQTIYDIETGSLISWPFSYRRVHLQDEEISIRGDSLIIPEFKNTGRQMTYERIYNFSDAFLSRYKIKADDRKKINEYVSQVLLNHYAGNEESRPLPEKPEDLSLWGRMALIMGSRYYKGRLEDPEPDDLNIEINDLTGSWSPLP